MTEKPKEEETKARKPSPRAKKSESKEGAPKTETPEKKVEPPVESPRDEEPELETPEKPSIPAFAGRESTLNKHQVRELEEEEEDEEEPEVSHAEWPEPDDDEIAELFRHVAHNPVNAHAPVWTPRTADPEGGWS